MLHQVGGREKSEFNVSEEAFIRMADFLASSPVDRAENIAECAPGSSLLTFDDVHEGVYRIAYPALRERNIPFTLFVSLSLLDRPGYITSTQLKEMAADPLATIGSHGMNHVRFRNLRDADYRRELSESKEALGRLLGQEPELFAFPYGSEYECGLTGKRRVRDYYRYGFGTVAMPVTAIAHDYFIPRINLTEQLIHSITDSK